MNEWSRKPKAQKLKYESRSLWNQHRIRSRSDSGLPRSPKLPKIAKIDKAKITRIARTGIYPFHFHTLTFLLYRLVNGLR